MELLAALGQYLLEAFVLPGLCYLLVFAMLYGDVLDGIRAKLPGESERESSLGLWISAVAVGAGLLLSSVTFAIELLFRHWCWFNALFPEIDVVALNLYQMGVLSAGAAVMHFNIAVGIFIILAAYPIYALSRDDAARPALSESARRARRRFRAWVAVGVLVLTCANLAVSSALFHRTQNILRAEDEEHHRPPPASWRSCE